MDGPDNSDGAELLNPTWADIETAIRRLDADQCSLVILGIGEPPAPHLAICGGNGKYLVYATEDNVTFHKLVNPNADEGKFDLVAAGQMGSYPVRWCVGLEEALRAAKTYAENGSLDGSLNWER